MTDFVQGSVFNAQADQEKRAFDELMSKVEGMKEIYEDELVNQALEEVSEEILGDTR